MSRRELPTGTVTFLFSDVEGSTKLLHELGADAYARLVGRHRDVVRSAIAESGGVEVGTEGDSFFVAFATAGGAVRAAAQAQAGLAPLGVRVRIGIHTGTPEVVEGDYFGIDVHRAARIASAAHGGQVVISASTVALTGTEGLRDLGEHRLKDLAAPERLWQLGDEDFPPLRSLYRTNLPIAATPFVGRERELAHVTSLLRDGARLLTLTGPGGTGKTRLAMQAAAEVAPDHPDGAWWVPLDAIRDPALVVETAAEALGAREGLAAHVADRAMLVAFDNFEQVIDAAADVAELLRACPRLRLIVTSREPLRIRGEREYAVLPLAREDAVRLFLDRVQGSGAHVEADADIREICRRLDDLPLAIELAAARARVLTPAQILTRLEHRLPLLTGGARDVPVRQRTLRAAIAWSHELLAPEEQRLYARLAVFRGGWAIEAAEAVCDADIDTLQALAEKSLVRREGERFAMLETIREHAAERLAASGDEQAMRSLHAAYFVALAERHERATLGGDPAAAFAVLTREHDNIRAALDQLMAEGDTQRAMRAAWALHEFWCVQGHAREGWARLEALLQSDTGRTRARALALAAAGHIAHKAGADRATEERLNAEALDLLRTDEDAWARTYVEYHQAGVLADGGDFAAARPLYEHVSSRFEELGDTSHALAALRSLAWATGELGDRPRERELYEAALRRAREQGDRRMSGVILGPLSFLAMEDDRYRDALALLREALPIHRAVGARGQVRLLFTRLAAIHAGLGRPRDAAALLGRSEALRDESGEADAAWVSRWKADLMSSIRLALEPGEVDAEIARGRAMTDEEAEMIGFAPLDDPATP